MTGKKKTASKGAYITGIITLILVAILAQVRLDIPVETLSAGYANDQSKFIDIDGLFVHYRDEGQGEPLVLIHGAASSLHTWDVWTEELKEDFRVIRMDLPAFGLTGPDLYAEGDYTLDYYADFLEKFLDKLNIEEAHLAGNSLGGGITWTFSRRYPERVKNMILVCPVGYHSEGFTGGVLIESPVVQTIVSYFTPEFAVNFFVRQVYGDNDKIEEDVARRYHRLLLREGNREALMQVMEALGNRDSSEDGEIMSEIEVPSLIIWGELDSLLPVDNAYSFHEDLPDSQKIIYEGVGHVPMEEIPVESAADTRDYLLN